MGALKCVLRWRKGGQPGFPTCGWRLRRGQPRRPRPAGGCRTPAAHHSRGPQGGRDTDLLLPSLGSHRLCWQAPCPGVGPTGRAPGTPVLNFPVAPRPGGIYTACGGPGPQADIPHPDHGARRAPWPAQGAAQGPGSPASPGAPWASPAVPGPGAPPPWAGLCHTRRAQLRADRGRPP